MTVASRKNHRADMLLRIRRREETAARRAFQQARRVADAAERRAGELQGLLAQQNDSARKGLLGGRAGRPAGHYPMSVTELLAALGQQRVELRRHDQILRERRAELSETITRCKAADILRRRIVARRSAQVARAEGQHEADRHAAREAGEPTHAT